jgi:hypothetical protein
MPLQQQQLAAASTEEFSDYDDTIEVVVNSISKGKHTHAWYQVVGWVLNACMCTTRDL